MHVNGHSYRRLTNDEHIGIFVDDRAGAGMYEPRHNKPRGHHKGLGFSIGTKDEVPERARHPMVCPGIHEMMMKMVLASPAAICAMTGVGVQAPMEHFVSDIGEHEARGKSATGDGIRERDGDGCDEHHDDYGDQGFFRRGREVVSLCMMSRVFCAKRRRAPDAAPVRDPAMNHIFEQAPRPNAE